jgi:predicted SprT family Zn-dependent metalloprotease
MNQGDIEIVFNRLIDELSPKYPGVKEYTCEMVEDWRNKEHYAKYRYMLVPYGHAACVRLSSTKRIYLLQSYFINHPEELEGILRHELAHVITYILGERHHGHKNKTYLHVLHNIVRGAIGQKEYATKRRKHKYIIACSKCGKEITKRKQRPTDKWMRTRSHRNCGGSLCYRKIYNEIDTMTNI